MKPICLIGARAGSKGVQKKNIRKFGKKPLIAHTIESVLKSNLFSHVIVSTEDKEIAKIALKYGAEVPFMRPKSLAKDNSSMLEVMFHTIKKLNELHYEFDILVNRDCTVPFIKNVDIKNAIMLLKKKNADLVCGVYKQHHNPYFNMMEKNSKGYLEFSKKLKKQIMSRQNAPIVYQLNGLHVINVKSLKKYKKLYMPKTLPLEISAESGFMIDTEFEFQIAEQILKNNNKF